MKNINKYIVEKFKISKDIGNENNNEMTAEKFYKLFCKPVYYICANISYKKGETYQQALIGDLIEYIKSVLNDKDKDINTIQPNTLPGVWISIEGKSDDKQKMVNLKYDRQFQDRTYGSTSRSGYSRWKTTYTVLQGDSKGKWIPTLGQVKKAWEVVQLKLNK